MGKGQQEHQKESDSEPVYDETYLKAKIKSYKGKTNTNVHNNKIPKESSQFISLPIILIDSVLRTGNNYYPQVVLEECEYIVQEKTMPEYITDDLEISGDSDRENSNKENSDQEILMKKIIMKKIKYRMCLFKTFRVK